MNHEIPTVPWRVFRKMDLHLIPLLMVSYLLSYLDRSNIAVARIANHSTHDTLDETLALTDSQAQLCISIFFVGYLNVL